MRRFLATLLTISICLGINHHARGQSQIQFSDPRVNYAFGGTLTIEAEINAENPIQNIFIYLETDRSEEQFVKKISAEDLPNVDFFLDLAENPLPVFSNIEYWFQVELYRAIQSGSAGPWRHLGTYEQPYRQSAIKTKTGWKWADFVLVRDQDDGQRKDLWEEPKGRGRADRPLRVPESDTAGAGDGPQPPPPSIRIG